MITNPKIKKIDSSISKLKVQMSELTARIKELEKRKTKLEDEEIVARFRRERMSEDDYGALKQEPFSPASIIKNNDEEREFSDADKN